MNIFYLEFINISFENPIFVFLNTKISNNFKIEIINSVSYRIN